MTVGRERAWTWTHRAGLLAAACVVLGAVSTVGSAQQERRQGERSVTDGVYTETQALRGKKTYETICIACHESRLWRDYWTTESLGDIFDTIRTNMPEDAPGSLTAGEYRDVLAYVLSSNQFPAGPAEIPEDVEAMRRVRMAAPEP